jgi:hypothetical protein
LSSKEDKIRELFWIDDISATLSNYHNHPLGITDPNCPACRIGYLDLDLTMQIGKKSRGFGGQGAYSTLSGKLSLDAKSYEVSLQHKQNIHEGFGAEISAGYGKNKGNKDPRGWLGITLGLLFR